jgi:hypothetical protein
MGLFSIHPVEMDLLKVVQVHLFGEGKVNQQHTFENDYNVTHLPRFKWGVCVFCCQPSLFTHLASIAEAEY